MADSGRSKVERAKGNVKTAAGKVTKNRRLTAKGRAEQTKGNAKEAAKKTKDTLTQ